MVDVISSNGYLNPAIAAMELAQMCVQAIWDQDSPLKQIPYFTTDLIKRCEKKGIESVFDIIDLDDDDRNSLLQMNNKQLREVARYVNRYPNIEFNHVLLDKDELVANSQGTIEVSLNRDIDEEDEEDFNIGPVIAPFFPLKKDEGWWIVVGISNDNSLLGIKRITLNKRLRIKLDFTCPNKPGEYKLRIYFMSDSYVGCDQEFDVDIDRIERLL
nr:12986_t:CDS:2 [Entrophospora candida]